MSKPKYPRKRHTNQQKHFKQNQNAPNQQQRKTPSYITIVFVQRMSMDFRSFFEDVFSEGESRRPAKVRVKRGTVGHRHCEGNAQEKGTKIPDRRRTNRWSHAPNHKVLAIRNPIFEHFETAFSAYRKDTRENHPSRFHAPPRQILSVPFSAPTGSISLIPV